jgi:hypothetical protein
VSGPTIITADAALAALQKAVTEKGEDYNPRNFDLGCVYSSPTDGSPCCLVGQALHNVGAPLPLTNTGVDMDEQVGLNYARINSVLFLQYLDREGFLMTSEALNALYVAQVVQDDGQPWGDALHAAQQSVAHQRSDPSKDNRIVNAWGEPPNALGLIDTHEAVPA